MSQILTMRDVEMVEHTCLTAGSHAAFSAQAMLVAMRSYRQAIALIRALPWDERQQEFLQVVDKRDKGD